MQSINSKIKAAKGDIKATLVIKNIGIVNVFTQEIEVADIAIYAGEIVGIGIYNGEVELDGTNMYASPGLMDAHVHIESSMMTPTYFSRALLTHGITTIIADPHEIANVHDIEGIEFMIKDTENSAINIHYMAPSCVPAVAFENGGAELKAEDLITLKNNNTILGLAEVMDVPALLSCEEDMMKKMESFRSSVIDGHAPLLTGKALNAYITAGVKTDHECSDAAEALEKIKKGMYVLIREGSAAKNLEELLPAVTDFNYHRFLFCTDDRHADDLLEEGSIDHVVRKAIKLGMNPVRALTISSFNVAQCYNLKNVGAIAPGHKADIILFNDINNLGIQYVIKDGEIVDLNGQNLKTKVRINNSGDKAHKNSMNIKPINPDQLKVKVEGNALNVIRVSMGSLITNYISCNFEEENSFVTKVNCEDVLKIAVFERHKFTGNYFVGYITGLGIKNCSIAQTIAHDSHNIVVIGNNNQDMVLAVNSLIASGGGIAIASDGVIKGMIELPIAGLMKAEPVEVLAKELKYLREILKDYSSNEEQDIFITLGFMSLPVIPHIKITTKGLFDYDSFSFTSLFEKS